MNPADPLPPISVPVPQSIDDLADLALNTTDSMLRLMAGETLAQFNRKARLMALSALLRVAEGQLHQLRSAVVAEILQEVPDETDCS